MESHGLEPDALLQHSGFLRALSRSLVGDASRADDLVQETWLAALKHPPRTSEDARPWLGRVVRNVASNARRGEQRRRAREADSAARPRDAAPSAAEIAQRLATQRAVLGALIALDEAYRATIFLRFYENLPPREIARRLGVPVETVRSRLRRGLERLRESLDREYGGDRGTWCAALAPWAAIRRNAPRPIRGARVMRTRTGAIGTALSSLAAVSVVAIGLLVSVRADERPDAEPGAAALVERTAGERTSRPNDTLRGGDALRGGGDADDRTALPAIEVAGSAVDSAPTNAPLLARVVDSRTGEPVPDLTVAIEVANGAPDLVRTRADGSLASARPVAVGELTLSFHDGPGAAAVAGPSTVRIDAAGGVHELAVDVGPTYALDAELPPGIGWSDLVVRLRDPEADVELEAVPREGPRPWVRFASMPGLSILRGGTRSRFALTLCSRDLWWEGAAEVRGEPGRYEPAVRFDLEPRGRVRGTLRGPRGEPLANVAIELAGPGRSADIVRGCSGEDGSFLLGPVPPGVWSLAARRRGAAVEPVTVTLAGGDEVVQDLVLISAPSADLRGTLVSLTGAHEPVGALRLIAVDDANVVLEVDPVPGRTLGAATFAFDDVPVGEYDLLPPMGDFLPWREPVTRVSVGVGGARRVELVCLDEAPTFELVLRVVDARTGAELDGARSCLFVDRYRLGKEAALELEPKLKLREPARGAPTFAGVPQGTPFEWLVELDGYRSAADVHAGFRGEDGARFVIDVELERSWRAAFVVETSGDGGERVPLADARVRTEGGSELGRTLDDGTAYVELSYDPGALVVELDGWNAESWKRIPSERGVVQHFVRMTSARSQP